MRRLRADPGGQLARWLIAAIRDNDERKVEKPVLQLARTRRIFVPLVLAAGAFFMLFNGFGQAVGEGVLPGCPSLSGEIEQDCPDDDAVVVVAVQLLQLLRLW